MQREWGDFLQGAGWPARALFLSLVWATNKRSFLPPADTLKASEAEPSNPRLIQEFPSLNIIKLITNKWRN